MWKTVLTRLVSALPVLIALAGYPASVWVGYNTGYENSQVKKNAEIAQMKLINAEAKNSANKLLVEQLDRASNELKAWQAKAQTTSQQLAEANQAIQRHAANTKKEIQDAIVQDKNSAGGGCIDGLGTNSVRQYNNAINNAINNASASR